MSNYLDRITDTYTTEKGYCGKNWGKGIFDALRTKLINRKI